MSIYVNVFFEGEVHDIAVDEHGERKHQDEA